MRLFLFICALTFLALPDSPSGASEALPRTSVGLGPQDASGPLGEFQTPSARDDYFENSVSDILDRLGRARSVRWCSFKEGIPSLTLRSLEEEKNLVEELKEAVEAATGTLSAGTALQAASILAGAGYPSEALAVLTVAQVDGAQSDILFLKTLCLDRIGRKAEASKSYEMCARRGYMLGDYATLYAARCQKRQGFVAAGAKTLERLVGEWGHSPVWAAGALQLCEYYLSLERYESCAGVAELVASKAARSVDRNSGLFFLGQALEEAGRAPDAYGAYWKVVKNNPSHPKAGVAFKAMKAIRNKQNRGLSEEELYKGGVALARSGNHREAAATLKELLGRGRDGKYWIDGARELARISYARRRYTEAAERYRTLVEAGGRGADEALLWVGKCELRAGRYKKAFEILETLGRSDAPSSVRIESLWESGREKESQGLWTDALSDYEYAATHLSATSLGSEACWRLGFCRYLTEDLDGAIAAFELAGDVAGAGYLKAQALYWLAKTHWRLGQRQEAEEVLRAAAREGPGVYYGARAAWILESGIAGLDERRFALPGYGEALVKPDSAGALVAAAGDSIGIGIQAMDPTQPVAPEAQDSVRVDAYAPPAVGSQDSLGLGGESDPVNGSSMAAGDCLGADGFPGFENRLPEDGAKAGSARWHFARGQRLLSWGEKRAGASEIQKAAKLGLKRAQAIDVLDFHDCYIQGMLVAGSPVPKYNSRPAEGALYASFPLGFADHVWRYSGEAGLDPYLALSIIRQESRFDPGAVSGAGARGLMQIMPATGRKVSRDLGVRWRGTSGLLNPETNIRMGTHYFAEMYEDLGNLPAALAAYNGGAGKAREWSRLAGDKGLDAYIEMIGYKETRKYVKLVLMWYLTYVRLYQPGGVDPAPGPAAVPSKTSLQ